MQNRWFGTSPVASNTELDAVFTAGTGLIRHRGWDLAEGDWSSWTSTVLSTRAGPNIPWKRALGPLPGPFPWDWGLCPQGFSRSRVDPLGPKPDLSWGVVPASVTVINCSRNIRANQREQRSPHVQKADASLGTSLELKEYMKKISGYGITQAMTKPPHRAGHLHHARYNFPKPMTGP